MTPLVNEFFRDLPEGFSNDIAGLLIDFRETLDFANGFLFLAPFFGCWFTILLKEAEEYKGPSYLE
jgi:hypothetical protein